MDRSSGIVVDEGLPTGPLVVVLAAGAVVEVRSREDGEGRPATEAELRSFYAHVLGEAPFCYPFAWTKVSPFARRTLEALRRMVPPGETRSYGALAAAVGRPGAARAVGRVMAANPFPVLYPCHRVVAGDGGLGGYSMGGPEVKARLLAWERHLVARRGAR